MSTTLVLGGVRSGKSRYAERLLRDAGAVTYLAPGRAADGDDPEWTARVAEHRARRPERWSTVETLDLAGTIREATQPLLIDCLGVWLAGFIDGIEGWERPQESALVVGWAVRDLVTALSAAEVDVVVVSNEVGLGVVPPTPSGRLFRDELGRLNAAVSAVSDHVFLVVAGRVLDLSDAPLVGE